MWLIRPSAETAVASVITSAAAPMANWPRCIRCQSVAEPCEAWYWHIGETTIRLVSMSCLSENGENSAPVIQFLQ